MTRPLGRLNKTTVERQLRAKRGLKNALDGGLLPLDVMVARLRDTALPSGRKPTQSQFEAAVAAAPYVHPRLSAIAYQKVPPAARFDVSQLTQEERVMLLGMLRRGLVKGADAETVKTIEGAAEKSDEGA